MSLVPEGKWLVQLKDGSHIIRAKRDFWEVLKIWFDNKLIYEKFSLSNIHFRFKAGEHEFVLVEKGLLNRHFVLIVDEIEYAALDEIVTTDRSDASKTQSDVQIVREDNVQETTQIVDVEEFPLDNTAGTDVLEVEHEVSKTVSNELSINTSTAISSALDLDFLSALKLQISANLAKQLGQNIGETITRRQTLHFTVQPHCSVTYLVIWKRKVRTADCLVFANGKLERISYHANYDLSYEVKSQ